MENEKRLVYEKIVENTSDGILVIGFDSKIRTVNPACRAMLNISGKDLRGKTIASFVGENDKNDEFFNSMTDAVFTKKKTTEVVSYYRGDKKRYFRMVTSLLREEKDEESALIVLISDITEEVQLVAKNEELSRRLMAFVNNFVQMMIDAIDKRTPYNATHTRKMVNYTQRYLDYLAEQGRMEGYNETKQLLASVWLHDIGKLIVPTEIMDKPTRLGTKETEVLQRIDIGILMEKLRMQENPEVKAEAEDTIAKLEAAKEVIKAVNTKGFLSEELREKVAGITGLQCKNAAGETVPLLNDYEAESLSVVRGTLTAEERKVMEAHATHTFDLLNKLGFKGEFEKVPIWAARHHEYLDGSGYPEGVDASEIPWETRLITIVDVYDALTAEDRPYKKPMPPEKAFSILEEMAKAGKIDKDILADFIKSKAWEPERK